MDTLVHLSGIERVVLLVDLHPLLHHSDPDAYFCPLLSAACRILSSPPLVTAATSPLFAYKLFFSSLSPILSTSNVHRLLGKSPTFLSFDRPAPTLASLSAALVSLASAVPQSSVSVADGSNWAWSLAQSLLQLEHDYGWESDSECIKKKGTPQELLSIRPNLVLLFSTFLQDPNFLSKFVGLEVDDCVRNSNGMIPDTFLGKFLDIFRAVQRRMGFRGIHLSWINVCATSEKEEEQTLTSEWLTRGVKKLGWGFSSTDVIVLGSAVVPFGLILPYIACKVTFKDDGSSNKGNLELVLEIEDVNGKPLECKSCDLELHNPNLLGEKSDMSLPLWNDLGSGNLKIHVKKLCSRSQGEDYIKYSHGFALLSGTSRGYSGDSSASSKGEFFADSILNLCCGGRGKFIPGKPEWQLLLSFLYKRNYMLYVSISDAYKNSKEGIIMPFTVNCGILTILELKPLGSQHSVSRNCTTLSENFEMPSPAYGHKDDKGISSRMHSSALQQMTWNTFREAVFSSINDGGISFDLEELYFSRKSNNSKKLRFFKCWMRQIKKSISGYNRAGDEKEECVVKENAKVNRAASEYNLDIDAISSSTVKVVPSESTEDEAFPFYKPEDTETFIVSIPEKVEQGLCSQDSDLRNLAERLVALSIQALYTMYGRNVKDAAPKEVAGDPDLKIAVEVSHLLLRKPKDLLEKYKGTNHASAPINDAVSYSREYKIREHELQILFRMEMLRSEIAASIEENVKRKMVKDVCSLLQFIDLNLQGDLFGGHGIVDFAERSIKLRYCQCLPDIVQKIYCTMEFDLFDEDDVEASNSLPNSDSNEFKVENDANDRKYVNCAETPVFTSKYWKGVKVQEAHDDINKQKLLIAQERRDKSRRIKSFTSWIPDLQRVWAPKHLKQEKLACAHLKPSKGKKRRLSTKDIVCETPLTEEKGRSRRSSHKQEDDESSGHNSCKSLSKALFHEDLKSGMA